MSDWGRIYFRTFLFIYIHNIVEAAVQWLEHGLAMSLTYNIFVP